MFNAELLLEGDLIFMLHQRTVSGLQTLSFSLDEVKKSSALRNASNVFFTEKIMYQVVSLPLKVTNKNNDMRKHHYTATKCS